MRTCEMALFFAPVLALAACGSGGSDGEADDVGAALPRAETLRVGLPAAPAMTAAAKPGQPAELWLLTRRTADDLNGMIGSVVGQMGGLLAQPPTRSGEGEAEWGPFTPTLSPVTYHLVAARSQSGIVAYHLDGRPRGGGDFVVLVSGTAAADGHAGEIHVDLAALRALDPAAPPDGDELGVVYDREPEMMTLALELPGAHYAYAQRASGAGELDFDGPPGQISASWLASGAGRAEVDGAVAECWDDGFRLVFSAGGADGAEGDPTACPDVQ